MTKIGGTLDDRYLEWLYGQIGAVSNRNPERSYWHLLRHLYSKPFRWFVPNDDNRAADGVDLRYDFLEGEVGPSEREWMDLDCSFLEMMFALAQRASYESSGEPAAWFWKMVYNLGLIHYNDSVYNDMVKLDVEDTLDNVIERTYHPDGQGGLFPLDNPTQDQREVELWYQMSAYLLEGGNADLSS